MTPNSVTPGFTGSPLDRTDENRPRDEVIAAWRAHPEARVMLLDALDPVIAPGGGLAWMPLDLLPPDATTLFLGLHNGAPRFVAASPAPRSEEHTSELQSLMRLSYAVFCLKKKNKQN